MSYSTASYQVQPMIPSAEEDSSCQEMALVVAENRRALQAVHRNRSPVEATDHLRVCVSTFAVHLRRPKAVVNLPLHHDEEVHSFPQYLIVMGESSSPQASPVTMPLLFDIPAVLQDCSRQGVPLDPQDALNLTGAVVVYNLATLLQLTDPPQAAAATKSWLLLDRAQEFLNAVLFNVHGVPLVDLLRLCIALNGRQPAAASHQILMTMMMWTMTQDDYPNNAMVQDCLFRAMIAKGLRWLPQQWFLVCAAPAA